MVGHDLRRDGRLAGLRLDGRRQGRPRVTNRYLARDLGPEGIRVNLVSRRSAQDPGRQGDPGLRATSRRCGRTARRSAGTRPTTADRRAVVALLSDFFPATTGEIVHVDGGFHAMGA